MLLKSQIREIAGIRAKGVFRRIGDSEHTIWTFIFLVNFGNGITCTRKNIINKDKNGLFWR